MLRAAQDALGNPPVSVWQRVPILPAFFGQALIRSQAPGTKGKYTAPVRAQPTTSDIPADILERFARQQHELAEWMRTFDDRAAARATMISPFVRFITYSVQDGCRILVAHDHRH